ncbi:MAG: anthranilate synthase component I family protein [Ardenticatenaceae bacterium]
MIPSGNSKSYYEYWIPKQIDPLLLLQNLIEHDLLSEHYMMYRNQDEVWIAGNPLAKVWVDCESISHDYMGQTRSMPVTDPFKQIDRILAELPMTNWRAYGYVGFDISRFYYPYSKAMTYPLLYFFVPAIEAHLTKQGVRLRSIMPLDQIESLFSSDNQATVQQNTPIVPPPPELAERERYQSRVEELVEAINDGQLQKAIISRRVEVKGQMDVLATYALSARHNTGARSYCMSLPDVQAVGFSPEILMKVDQNRFVMTNPLAATRPRGVNEEGDKRLYNELFTDAKEVKEHALSVWLAQEEITRVCSAGTAQIFDFMEVKKYRTVQHLSSRVGGQLKPENSLWDALSALFPGITVSGIDKTQALAWIDRLEEEARGIYAGSIGWVDSNGTADLCIALRSIFQYGETISYQAGAGIVGESNPEFEYTESVNKMKTMLNDLVMKS